MMNYGANQLLIHCRFAYGRHPSIASCPQEIYGELSTQFMRSSSEEGLRYTVCEGITWWWVGWWDEYPHVRILLVTRPKHTNVPSLSITLSRRRSIMRWARTRLFSTKLETGNQRPTHLYRTPVQQKHSEYFSKLTRFKDTQTLIANGTTAASPFLG